MVIHSRDLTSHIDELQRIARNLRGPAHHHDGNVSLQEEQIRRTSDAHEGYT